MNDELKNIPYEDILDYYTNIIGYIYDEFRHYNDDGSEREFPTEVAKQANHNKYLEAYGMLDNRATLYLFDLRKSLHHQDEEYFCFRCNIFRDCITSSCIILHQVGR